MANPYVTPGESGASELTALWGSKLSAEQTELYWPLWEPLQRRWVLVEASPA
jgi:hypothetical protein